MRLLLGSLLLAICHGLTVMPPLAKTAEHLPLAGKAMEYFDKSSDPFLAVQTSIDMLVEAGFEELDDMEPYAGKIIPGGRYFFTRNKSTLVAFSVGKDYEAGRGGFKVIGGHTDSPNLRVKPRSKRSSKSAQSIQIGVECYGGGLWNTWFDRDLGISGRVFLRSETGGVTQRLIKIDRAILRVPNLAIHLQTAKEREAFSPNKEDHLSPILAMAAKKALSEGSETEETDEKKEETPKDGWVEHQEPLLLKLLAEELDVEVDDIVDFELSLFDVQKAALGGIHSEFIHSARLDNLASCFLAVEALVDYVQDKDTMMKDQDISMVVLYDHEEVGSSSADSHLRNTSSVGAAGPILGEAVKRISSALNTNGDTTVDMLDAIIRRSFVLSSDQAHALHPNYAAKHEKNHQPQMNGGMVIKRNANQRYATNGVTGVLVREIARRASLPPIQEFIVRQDCGCGSTIGPLISTATGIRAIDMGCPQLSMHSIRETMGVCDLTSGLNLFKAFFRLFREVDESIEQ
eukprot:scaffold2817_cov130-Cylindrotheca_fusiformis.AAC.11